jgi:excisionase family DNA binding protein
MTERWPALLKRDEAAAYLGVGVTTFNGLVAVEEIKPVRIAGAIRYRRTDLDGYVERLEEGRGEFRGSKRETAKNGNSNT